MKTCSIPGWCWLNHCWNENDLHRLANSSNKFCMHVNVPSIEQIKKHGLSLLKEVGYGDGFLPWQE
jgi:hypothetical protein